MQSSQADEFLRATCSRPFLRRYRWGINLRTSSLPIAYLLLKQKDFKGARPISYIHFLYAKLFRATAIALDVIMRATCPRSFGLNTLPSILQQLTQFFQLLPDDAHPVVFKQDLVGFFTSIPVFRILNAVRWAVNEYSMLQKSDVDSITFSGNLLEQDTKLRVWRRRPRKAAKRTVLIHLSFPTSCTFANSVVAQVFLPSCTRSSDRLEELLSATRFLLCLPDLQYPRKKRST